MPKDRDQAHKEHADELRNADQYIEAGEYYTLSAYGRFGLSVPNTYGTKVSLGMAALLRGAVCYRVGGRLDRCQNRCRQGILVAEDMIERVFDMEPPDYPYDRARRGAWHEYVGDFRCIGDVGDPDAAYERAIEVYLEAGDSDTICSEQEHWYTMAVYREVANAVDADPGPIDDHRNDMTLSDWVERKQTTYPALLTELTSVGKFPEI